MNKRRLLLILLYAVVLAAGWMVGKSLLEFVTHDVGGVGSTRVRLAITVATSAYILASAVPFVPGLEIGLGLLVVFGSKMAPLVYVSLVVALTASYLVGRFVPPARVAAAFNFFGLGRARDLVLRLAPLDEKARLDLLTGMVPAKMAPIILRYRYPALALLFNVPGNSVIGGGGGIGFMAGMSRLYSLPGYLVTVLIGAAPVPLLFAAVEGLL